MNLKLATRNSKLALIQSHLAQIHLSQKGFDCSMITVQSYGDQNPDIPLAELAQHHSSGAKASFAHALESSLLSDDPPDLAVHSLKDLRATDEPPLSVVCTLPRHSPYDVCLIKKSILHDSPTSLQNLSQSTSTPLRLATSSARRAAFLSATQFVKCDSIRGNIDTRLDKVMRSDSLDGLVTSMAAVVRLKPVMAAQLEEFVSVVCDPHLVPPCAGAGVIAVQMHNNHPHYQTIKYLSCLNTHLCSDIERAIVAALGADCTSPLGCFVHTSSPTCLHIHVALPTVDGSQVARSVFDMTLHPSTYYDNQIRRQLITEAVMRVLSCLKEDGYDQVKQSLSSLHISTTDDKHTNS